MHDHYMIGHGHHRMRFSTLIQADCSVSRHVLMQHHDKDLKQTNRVDAVWRGMEGPCGGDTCHILDGLQYLLAYFNVATPSDTGPRPKESLDISTISLVI